MISAAKKCEIYIQCDWIAEYWECLCLSIYYMSYHSFPYILNHIKKFHWICLANKFGIRKKLTRRKNWFLFFTQLVRRWTCIDVNRFFSLEIFNESKTLTWKLEHDQNMFLTYFLCVDSQETDDLESTLFFGHTLFTCSPIRIRWLLYLQNIYRASFLFRLRLYSNSSIWPFVYIVQRYPFISIWHQMEHKMT